MDSSPEYIKMCEKAEEIQQSKRKSGLLHGDYVYAEFNSPFTFFTGKVELFTGDPHLRYGLFGCIFIPRQDQLQEMMGKYGHFKPFTNALINFAEWYRIERTIYCERNSYEQMETRYSSMEQLWLAFVMSERYNKVWDSTLEEWVIGG